MDKKKSSAEATANLIDREQYIKIRQTMQTGTHVLNLFDYLWNHDSITPMECYEKLNNTRIGSTVGLLRHNYGVPIKTEKVTRNGRTYGVYSLERSDGNV